MNFYPSEKIVVVHFIGTTGTLTGTLINNLTVKQLV